MHCLLYVSTRRLRADMGMQDVDEILAVSRARNVTLDVTGALVATPTHYAQMLEGSEAALGELMESIGRDPRHSDIRLAPAEQKPHRDLAKWSLAYSGDSDYVARMIAAAIQAPDFELQKHVASIRALMLMFA